MKHAQRVILAFPVYAVSILAAGGCSDDLGPRFADVAWQVRCGDMSGCPNDEPPHVVNNADGQDGVQVDCAITRPREDVDVFRFRVGKTTTDEDYVLEIDDLIFPHGGGALLADCSDEKTCAKLAVEERNFTLEGKVSTTAPTINVPCQAGTIEVSDESAGPTVSGTVYCEGIQLNVDNTITRNLSAPGASNDMTPVSFRLVNCNGF